MKPFRLYIIMTAAIACVMTANAEEPELSKEITIETDFVPVEQKVVKLNALPGVANTTVPKKQLSYTDWSERTRYNEITVFEPFGYNTKLDYSQTKGYLDFGIGSQLNIVGSAGYTFYNQKGMKASAWLQHNSTWLGKNSSPLADETPNKQKFNDNVLGVNFSKKFTMGTLNASTYYHLDHFNYYGANETDYYKANGNQTVNEFAIKAGWENVMTTSSKLQYSAELMFDHFGYAKGVNDSNKGLKENSLLGRASAEMQLNIISVGMHLTGNYLGYSNMLDNNESGYKTGWMGMVTFSPYARYKKSGYQVLAGLNVDISARDGSRVNVSPNIKADARIDNGISVYAEATGGKRLNRLFQYHTICRYLSPNETLGSTFVPIDGEIGIKLGAFKGFNMRPFFGYGIFKNQISPYINHTQNTADGVTPFTDLAAPYVFIQKTDIKGWKAGVEVGYKYNDLLDITLNVKFSPQDLKSGYIFGLDRPSNVVNLDVKITPIKPLAITLGYELRNGRKCYSYHGMVGSPAVHSWGETKLDDVNNLSLFANYQVNKTFSVFVNASNLLNQQWDNYLGMGAQKINALAGVNLTF